MRIRRSIGLVRSARSLGSKRPKREPSLPLRTNVLQIDPKKRIENPNQWFVDLIREFTLRYPYQILDLNSLPLKNFPFDDFADWFMSFLRYRFQLGGDQNPASLADLISKGNSLQRGTPGIRCDEFAVLMGHGLKFLGLPARLVGLADNKKIHGHTAIEASLNGKWGFFDPSFVFAIRNDRGWFFGLEEIRESDELKIWWNQYNQYRRAICPIDLLATITYLEL